MRTPFTRTLSALPLAAILLAGCGHKDTDDTTTNPPPAATSTSPAPAVTPPGPMNSAGAPAASLGGPGGTMMNTKSTNPNGATGDAVMTMKVKTSLIADSHVKASAINVDTKSNTVVLRGSQPTKAGITAAVADAHKVEGVKNVINQLTVRP